MKEKKKDKKKKGGKQGGRNKRFILSWIRNSK